MKPVYIKLSVNCYREGEIIWSGDRMSMIILKYIKDTRWERFKVWLGFPNRIGSYKVKNIK